MKRFLVLLGVAAAMVVSCSIEEESPIATTATDGSYMTLSGEMYTATKVSIGEKDGEVYPLLWYTGDELSIYSTDGTWSAVTAALTEESVGQKSGTFHTTKSLDPETDTELVILYPGGNLTYAEGVITGTVASSQTQAEGNSSVHVGSNCFSYDVTEVEAGQTEGVTFALSQKTAFAKVTFELGEDYSDYYLSGVKLTAEGFDLAGSVSYDIEEKEMTVTDGIDNIEVKLTDKPLVSENPAVYFTVLPCDLTEADVTIVVTLTDNNNNDITIPIQRKGGKFTESCLSLITVDIKDIVVWYDPIETRDLLGGWAYGPQNTFLIEQFTSGQNSITIDVKARGDFSMVKEPKYYSLLSGSSGDSNRNLCVLPDGTSTYQEVPTNEVSEDYTITVNVYSSSSHGHWATVGLYDEEYNIIWSFLIWKYYSGDEPADVVYTSDITLMDRNIGAPYSNYAAETQKSFDGAPAYFQWGRKDAFPVQQLTANYTWVDLSTTGNDGYDIARTISHPGELYNYNNGTTNWRNDRTDLWGGVNNTENWYDPNGVGHKTIYDPCPEGYRVPDAIVLYELEDKMEYWEKSGTISSPTDTYYQPEEKINPDSPFYSNGMSVFAYPLSDGSYDYWPYVGLKFGTNNFTNNGGASSGTHAGYMFNSTLPGYPRRYVAIRYYYGSTAMNDTITASNYTNTMDSGMAAAVRCQKEQ